MNHERSDSAPGGQTTESGRASERQGTADAPPKSNDGEHQPATIVVRGEAVTEPSNGKERFDNTTDGQAAGPAKAVSESKVRMRHHLPVLEDDGDVGVPKEQMVVRDGKADLAFTGTLLASAAPATAPTGQWEEFRVYETSAEKFVFSKVTRHSHVDEHDEYQAEVFEPEPSSKSSQLLRSARDLTRSSPLTWKDAAVDFFGYEPLAKSLYRKLGDGFEERIS